MAPAPIVLASSSPRRAELLTRIGLDFQIRPADIDESYLAGETAEAHAERLAREKALAVAGSHPDAIVIGSDTIVVLDDEVLVKPVDGDDAVRMLRRLSGREHRVFTGVAVCWRGESRSSIETVRVRFRTLTDQECRDYVATGEPMDKAGSYGIQGYGSAIVEAIEGDYFAVMGLPIVRLLGLIRQFGVEYRFGEGLTARS